MAKSTNMRQITEEKKIKKKHIHTKRQEEKKKRNSVCVGVCNTQKLDANDE